MACERFRDALADVAAGLPAPAAVEAHLAACEACRTELEALRHALAVADAELARLLAAEPAPALAVRIRRGVAEAEAPPARRLAWLWPATAVAATALVALVVVTGRGTPPTPEPRVAGDAARPEPTGSTPVAEPSGGPANRSHGDAVARARGDRAPARSRPTGRRAIPAEPEVLVPPGETEELIRLVGLVHRDRRAPASLAAAGQPSADLAELPPIDIKPLEIVPLDPAETPGT